MNVYAINTGDVKKMDMDQLTRLMPRRMEKAARYRFENDRLLGIGAGYLLMTHLGIKDETLIKENEYGKPYADGYPDFSLSHSGDIAVFSMSDEADGSIVGVDIEIIKDFDMRVSKKVYTPREINWMNINPKKRFFELWTKKESVMKALGMGFHLPASSFEVITQDDAQSITVEGRRLYLRTKEYDGYYISICSSKKMEEIQIIT